MCLDGGVSLMYLAAAASAASTMVQYSQASDAADEQEQTNKNTREALERQRDGERMDSERMQQQAQEEAAAAANAHAMDAYKDMAAFDAIAGENGGGVTSQRASAALGIRQGQDLATINSNAQKRQAEIGFGDFASSNRQKASMAAIPSVKQPSLLAAGLTIAGAGLSAQAGVNKIKANTGATKVS